MLIYDCVVVVYILDVPCERDEPEAEKVVAVLLCIESVLDDAEPAVYLVDVSCATGSLEPGSVVEWLLCAKGFSKECGQ